jgi:hypothetical protein
MNPLQLIATRPWARRLALQSLRFAIVRRLVRRQVRRRMTALWATALAWALAVVAYVVQKQAGLRLIG